MAIPRMTSVKIHRKFPFARTGLTFDLYPDCERAPSEDEPPEMNQWLVVFEGPGNCEAHVYDSEKEAIAGVDAALFSRGNERLVEYHLKRALKAADYKLALRLAEGRGRAQGYREAAADMKNFLFFHPHCR